MAQNLGPTFGNGRNGELTVSTNSWWDWNYYGNKVGYGSCTATAGTNSMYVTDRHAAWSIVEGDIIFIHQTRGPRAGQWEFNIAGETFPNSTSATVSVKIPLSYNFSTGSQVIKVPQCLYININAGITLNALQWNGINFYGGIIPLMCNGTTKIDGLIDASGKGFAGGRYGDGGSAGNQGEGTNGPGSDTTIPNGNGGGGGHDHGTGGAAGCGGGGGGNASYGTGGSAGQGCPGGGTDYGQGGEPSGDSNLVSMTFGGGGGGGGRGDYDSANGKNGGAGGGIIILISKTIIINGGVYSNGVAGDNGYFSGAAGGGGAGGSILLRGLNINMGSNIVTALQASGGTRGNGGHWGGAGGAGSSGRIRVEQCSMSGSTNGPSPSITTNIMPWAGRVGIMG